MQHSHTSLLKYFALLLLLLGLGLMPVAESSVRPPGAAEAIAETAQATAPATPAPAGVQGSLPSGVEGLFTVKDPGSDLWRAVRQREGDPIIPARSQMGSDATVLMNVQGQAWREFRMEKLIPYGMLLIGGVLLAIVLFRLIRGKIKLQSGRSGIKVPRFTLFQRIVHWIVAILFVVLGLTGLILTFGRDGLIPIMGNEAFGYIAYAARRIHDYAGPAFGIALLVMFFTFLKGNFGRLKDILWFLKGGGMFGGHVSAGRYNAGEKLWFWTSTLLLGSVVVISGLVLDFPNFGQSRDTMELSHMIHGVSALLILAFSFGHIYMGTAAVEGAFETMQTGYADANWAKEHHDEWYDEMVEAGHVGKSFEDIEGEKSVHQPTGNLSSSAT